MLPDKDMCTGCMACANICSKKCISFEYDEEGFWQPSIDNDKCIKCNLCTSVCPVLKDNSFDNENNPICFAVQDKEIDNLRISSSGGIFGVVAEYVIKQNGVVYGAIYDNDSSVIYGKAENKEELKKIRGTKYVQANVGDKYNEAMQDLKEGRWVLFTGTPCIIAGLYNLLELKKINSSKLITMDLICHGVPSPFQFRMMISYFEKKDSKKVKKFIFRPKTLGWGPVVSFRQPEILCEDETAINIGKYDRVYAFFYAFLQNLNLRRSCYKCKFAKLPRVADFTIGDFWGIEEYTKFPFNKTLGLSCVLINNTKAEEVFNIIAKKMNIKEEPIDIVKQHNGNLINGIRSDAGRKDFYEYYNEHSWEETQCYVSKILKRNDLIGRTKEMINHLIGDNNWERLKKIIRRGNK